MLGSGQTGAYTALSLIAALWGSYPAFAKLALVAFPPLVLVVHASPGSQTRGFDQALDANIIFERAAATDARIICVGHTHVPEVRDLGWKLIVNGETGQWGTAHNAAKDLYTIEMKMSTLPQVVERFTIGVDATDQGGTINLDWDTTRTSATFTVQK